MKTGNVPGPSDYLKEFQHGLGMSTNWALRVMVLI